MPRKNTTHPNEVSALIRSAKRIAKSYRKITGRPLGITGEVAEYEAARVLRLELAPVRQAGYDAIRRKGKKTERLQIKGRCVTSTNPGQRLGRIQLTKKWDAVLLVLMDTDLEPLTIHEARRSAIKAALTKPGSKARNIRGALSVSKFKSIGKLVWSR